MEFKDLADRFAKLQKKFDEITGQSGVMTLYLENNDWYFSISSTEFSVSDHGKELSDPISVIEKIVYAENFPSRVEKVKAEIEAAKKKYQAEKDLENLFGANVKDDKTLLN